MEALARHHEDNWLINLEECFIDGTFVVAKKGGAKVGKTKRGKGSKLMVIADASGLPVALHTDSANPHEVKLVQATLNEIVTVGRPEELSGIVPMTAIRLMKPLLARELNLSRRIGRTAKRLPHKMVECFADIKDDGKSNAFLRGLTNSEK